MGLAVVVLLAVVVQLVTPALIWSAVSTSRNTYIHSRTRAMTGHARQTGSHARAHSGKINHTTTYMGYNSICPNVQSIPHAHTRTEVPRYVLLRTSSMVV